MDSISILCLLFHPKTVHCSTKNVYTSEITFLALVPWVEILKVIYNIGLQGYRDIETSKFVTVELNSVLVCCFKQCYLQRMRLCSVVFDFHHNKYMYPSNVCTGPMLKPVQHLYHSDIC